MSGVVYVRTPQGAAPFVWPKNQRRAPASLEVGEPSLESAELLHFQPIRLGDVLLFDGEWWHGAAVEQAEPGQGARVSISFNLSPAEREVVGGPNS